MQAEIIQDPAKYVERDPAMARTLLDQREAVCWHMLLQSQHAWRPSSWCTCLPCSRDEYFCLLQGKILMLITNSDFNYTQKMMSFAYDAFLPAGKTWRDLFDMVRPLLCCAASSVCSQSLGRCFQ